MTDEYSITTLDDFLKVPADRLELCLSEVCCAIQAAAGVKGIADLVDPENSVKIGTVRWINDDKGQKKINVRVTTKP